MPTVTALRSSGPNRVAVELDGSPWRVLPLEAVVLAGLAVGRDLDRERARTLARERRRLSAIAAGAAALRHRSLSKRALARRLEQRGVVPAERSRAVDTLERAGLVDDARFAADRADALARRGYGDDYVRADLERQGLDAEQVDGAVAALEPEADRAIAALGRHGGGPRALRALARRGFSAESLEPLADVVARDMPAELG